MIDRLDIRNFKALRDVRLQLQPLTVFVGPNGAGKTSVLQAGHCLASLTEREWRDVFVGDMAFNQITSQGHGDSFSIAACSGDRSGSHLAPRDEPRTIDAGSRKAHLAERDGYIDRSFRLDRKASLISIDGDREQARDWLAAPNLLRLDASRLAAPSYQSGPTPRVASDGSGLASVLAFVKLRDEPQFAAILDALRRVIPSVRSVGFRREKIVRSETQIVAVGEKQVPIQFDREYWGDALVFDTTSGADLPAHHISEGTLLVLGLLTAMMQFEKPRLILLDDLDRALHPRAQAEVIQVLREFLQCHPDVQILATSHSPYLLDVLQPEEVRLMRLGDDGAAHVAKLSDHPEFERWRDVMRPGELWSTFGEAWIQAK